MRLRMLQVDAFTDRLFHGNPAAVVPLEHWLDDELMQAIALENNLSETAFFVPDGDGFHLRWWTPTEEVDFCGHATLASAFVLFTELRPGATEVRFRARCGPLVVRREGDLLAMDAPNWDPAPVPNPPAAIAEGLGKAPREVLGARDYVAIFATEEEVRALKPDMAKLALADKIGVLATAPGKHADFVSRCFFPRVGVPEDPVTGSAHSSLTPYWARRLGKNKLRAQQLSARGGELFCELKGDRVVTAGKAIKYLDGFIDVPG